MVIVTKLLAVIVWFVTHGYWPGSPCPGLRIFPVCHTWTRWLRGWGPPSPASPGRGWWPGGGWGRGRGRLLALHTGVWPPGTSRPAGETASSWVLQTYVFNGHQKQDQGGTDGNKMTGRQNMFVRNFSFACIKQFPHFKDRVCSITHNSDSWRRAGVR